MLKLNDLPPGISIKIKEQIKADPTGEAPIVIDQEQEDRKLTAIVGKPVNRVEDIPMPTTRAPVHPKHLAQQNTGIAISVELFWGLVRVKYQRLNKE
jgi:hypothetical protein